MRTRLDIEYDGTAFAGWAVQPGRRTVQGELERVLEVLRQARTPLTVAGRTDRGVHAWGQVASYDGEPADLRSLNALLPDDIAVRASTAAADDFDARGDATSRSYCFQVLARRTPSAFLRHTALHVHAALDVDALHACAALLPGTHDFTAFTPTETKHIHFARHVHDARWETGEDGLLAFHITATSFMRHMNRILVGTMLQVASGRRPLEEFAPLLAGGAHRRDAGPTAPPHGLALASVAYG